MKITAIKTNNFIGARDVDLTIQHPVTIIAGPNGSGKSSIFEAIRHALIGESTRVSIKKDYKQLLTDGSKVGYALVEYDGGRAAITLPNGTHEVVGTLPECLSFLLDAPLLSGLKSDDRGAFLFGLMGIKTDGEHVGQRLTSKGCNPKLVEQIIPFMRAGFEAAHNEASAKTREFRATWKVHTGEAYGSQKAMTWVAEKPTVDTRLLESLRTEAGHLKEKIDQEQSAWSEMNGRVKAAAEQAASIAGIRKKSGSYARIAEKLRVDEISLAEWKEKIDQANSTAGVRLKDEPSYPCPICGTVLRHDHANGNLVEYTPPPPVDVEAVNRISEYQRAHDLLFRSVENDRRDLRDADYAAKLLDDLEAATVAAPNTGEMDTLKVRIEEDTKDLKKALNEITAIETAQRAADEADSRTAKAADAHRTVQQWEEIARALAPDGIPAELLAAALEPINQRLASSAQMAEWARVFIDPADMSITAAGRPYALLSESEKWRTDAMLAEAVSFLSGSKLLVLDRFDVLDLQGREDLLYWLDTLAEEGEIDTALIFGTLKASPAVYGNIEAVWIENGTAGKMKEAA